MTQLDTAISSLDPNARLSEECKAAALKAGYGVSFLSDEAKYAKVLAERAALLAPPSPEIK